MILPNFTKLKSKVISQTHLTPKQIKSIRQKHLEKEIQFQTDRTLTNQKRILNILNTVSTHFLSLRETKKLEKHIKFLVIDKERKNDLRRNRVFQQLLGVKKLEEAKIDVIHLTETSIPSVLSVLENGIDRFIGGNPDEYGLLTSFENLYRQWVQ